MKVRSNLTPWFTAALALLAAGCAQEQAPINRVQPDYFDKSFFLGDSYTDKSDDPEFYSQATLIDVGYGAGQEGLFTSTYAQPVARVKWQVTEDHLIARLSYERVNNSDGKGVGGPTENGIVAASFKIIKHFDVAYDYNAQTGERNNVLVENDTDRPWFERQYMRVDWSVNESTDNYDFDTLSMLGVIGGVSYSPLAYSVLDPTDPDAPHFNPGMSDDGKTKDPSKAYLDITNKAFAKPADLIDLSLFGLGNYPACFFGADVGNGTNPSTGCSPVELTIRHSFKRVPNNDYEPADWDGFRFQAFGAFTTERYGYARDYGMTDTLWHRFISRYNIWDKSHFYNDPANQSGAVTCYTPATTPIGFDPHRDLDNNGTEDECEQVGKGSRCDTFNQKCTLPFRDRQTRPVVWYYASGSVPEYFDPTRDAALEWDVALRSSVMTARYAECVRTSNPAGDAAAQAACLGQFPVYDGQQDDNQDAVDLSHEVEDCRAGRSYSGQDCKAVADSVGAARGYTAGVIALAKMDPMLVLCHSPVESADNKLCAPDNQRLPQNIVDSKGTVTGQVSTAADCDAATLSNDRPAMAACNKALTVRRGDMRYHQVNGIRAPQTPSPWGIMVDSDDPLTGEKIASSINVWTHVNDLWSQSVVDISRYIKGELGTDQITDGTYVRDWAQAAESRRGLLPQYTAEQRDQALADALGVNDAKLLKQMRDAMQGTAVQKAAQKFQREVGSTFRAEYGAPSMMAPIYEARRQKILNTQTEAELLTPTMQQLAGTHPQALGVNMLQNMVGPMRGGNPTVMRNIRQAKQMALAARGACILEDTDADAPLGIANLADVLGQKFGGWNIAPQGPDQPDMSSNDYRAAHAEKIRQYLAKRAHYAVITHEMGHSIALRHNFVSSSDAYNYRPQYWQLRTNDGADVTPCTTVDPTGKCTGPRYWDPMTDNEKTQLETMFMQSTTMDYAGETTQDQLGLGAYDFAAARMFYGDVVSVYKNITTNGQALQADIALAKVDQFGGLLGWSYQVPDGMGGTKSLHYSQLQKTMNLIQNCAEVDASQFKPASWKDDEKGAWSPLFDGLIVTVNGKTTRCRTQPVDYVSWNSMLTAGASTGANQNSAHNIDVNNRVRVPYGFATDTWADLGNSAVYRHDNGADPYELFDFIITQQEVMHIFDNYRRNRQTFSVRTASNRQLERYNEKMRDSVKGLGLLVNVYRNYTAAQGYDFDTFWPAVAPDFFGDNLLGAGIAFDHFAREMSRPELGGHFRAQQGSDVILRSATDAIANPSATIMNVPNGATGFFGNVSWGGRPLENQLASDKGEYNNEYTVNCGSYYEKAFTTMLMTESVDNFISATRQDYFDARYRSVSVADVFPDGYRRFLANMLTGDDFIRGQRVAAMPGGNPAVDMQKYPTKGLGYTQWWKPSPSICFQSDTTLDCGATPGQTTAVEPQVDWEQQKFLIAWTMMYLPENQQQIWLNQMGIWELGADSDPGFNNRIELHLPDGKVYIAKTSGTEQIFGKTVQKGIGARMLEWGNALLSAAFVTTAVDHDGDGVTDWYVPTIVNGAPVVKYDPNTQAVTATGGLSTNGRPGCNSTDNSTCTCTSNSSCVILGHYQEVPAFMRQAMRDYGLADPSMKGLY